MASDIGTKLGWQSVRSLPETLLCANCGAVMLRQIEGRPVSRVWVETLS
jgi:hypothetical protein